MSYSSEMYDLWRKARIKFIKDNPATARALGLIVPTPLTDAEKHAAVNAAINSDENEGGVR
jgi:hypothetical protein